MKYIYLCPVNSANQIVIQRDDFFYITSTSIKGNYKNNIQVDIHDVYENLALKRLLGLKQVLENVEFDFVCCVDDDTFINFNNISRLNPDSSSNYGMLLSTTTNAGFRQNRNAHKKPFITEKIIYPAGGGYILSRNSLKTIDFDTLIYEVRENINNDIDMSYEDVVVGIALKRAKQPLVHCGYWINQPSHCFASCYNTFFHSTKIIAPNVFKSLSIMH